MRYGTRRTRVEMVGRYVALLSLVLVFPVAVSAADWRGEEEMAPILPATAVEEIEHDSEATQILSFQRSAATTYSPYNSTSTWAYANAGCRSRISGSPWYDLDIQVPNGVTLDFLRVYYYDTDATNDVSAFLYSMDGLGNSTSIATAQGTGTPGFSSAGSGFFSHIVDTTGEAIMVRLSLSAGTDSTLRACGVRLRYSIPTLFNDRFESGSTSGWDVTVP